METIQIRTQAMQLALMYYANKKTFIEIEKRAEEIYQFLIRK